MANRAEKLIIAGLAASTVGAAGYGLYQTGRNDGLSKNIPANTAEGQMPSPSMKLSSGETVTITPSPSIESNISIAGFGKDAWSQDASNWNPIIIDGVTRGEVLTPEPTGRNSLVSTPDAVGQAYWDARVSGEHQAIGLVIAKNLTLPVRGISVYPNNGEDANAHLGRAFDGQVKLEHETQPNVCTLEVTNSIQAVAGNEQSVSQDMWQAEKLTPQQAAAKFGRDAWSQNPDNWTAVDNGFGMKLAVNPKGLNSVVLMDGAVGQAYWDASLANEVSNGHEVIAGTLGVGVEAPVRGVTVYAGVPEGMGDGALGNAFNKAVNFEIQTQPGVYVVKVAKSDCPSAAEGGVVTPSATEAPATSNPTENPVNTPAPTAKAEVWYQSLKDRFGQRLHVLGNGGVVIEYGSAVKVNLTEGEVMDTPSGRISKPGTYTVTVATIYKVK